MYEIEIRCPVGPKRLLAKLLQEGGKPHIVEGNLVEFACDDCKKVQRRTKPSVVRVLHRFNLLGDCVQTLQVEAGEVDIT